MLNSTVKYAGDFFVARMINKAINCALGSKADHLISVNNPMGLLFLFTVSKDVLVLNCWFFMNVRELQLFSRSNGKLHQPFTTCTCTPSSIVTYVGGHQSAIDPQKNRSFAHGSQENEHHETVRVPSAVIQLPMPIISKGSSCNCTQIDIP